MNRKKTEREKAKSWKVKKSGIHRRGLFASANIEEGERIIEYVGEKITKAESERRADTQLERAGSKGDGAVYIFTLNKRHDIDGNVERNKARYANHSCDPNCETDIIRGRIWLIALRDIEKGEEIVYNYNFDLELYEDHSCRCGAKRCVGYIVGEEYWKKLKKKIKKKKKGR
ncbi:MAG: SET domain-containing protein, partial [Verrucomicrobiales bacterium]